MSAVLKGTAGLIWGTAEETGGLCQTSSITEQCDRKSVRDNAGEEVGASYYNVNSNYEVVIYSTGSTGLGGVGAAEALTSANFSPAAGLLMVTSAKKDRANEDYQKITISAVNNPLITS